MKKMLLIMLLPGLMAAAQAADIQAGGEKARSLCVSCHGSNGISTNPVWPDLAGQKEDYLALQMLAFKGGTRENPLMSPIAKLLSEEDIENLAAYYSSLSPCPR